MIFLNVLYQFSEFEVTVTIDSFLKHHGDSSFKLNLRFSIDPRTKIDNTQLSETIRPDNSGQLIYTKTLKITAKDKNFGVTLENLKELPIPLKMSVEADLELEDCNRGIFKCPIMDRPTEGNIYYFIHYCVTKLGLLVH